MAFIIHPDDMLREGLIAVKEGLDEQAKRCKESNISVFKSFFGKHPKHLARVFRDLQLNGVLDVDEEGGRVMSFKGFLVANNYMKCYQVLNVQASLFKLPKNVTGSLRWRFIPMIKELKDFKIKMPTPEEWAVARMQISVDGTHAKTNEPRDPDMRRNPKNFSCKNKLSF